MPTLRGELDQLHPADVAYILEALPLEERQVVWDLVKAEREGEILLELSEAVRESLIATMDSKELVAAAETLEADEIADLAPDLPEDVVQDVIRALPQEERALLRAALSYDEGTVGALMDFDQVTVREDVTLEAATRYLRALDELPAHTDQLFVVDRAGKLRGTLPLARLIVTDLARQVGEVMVPESVKLRPEDRAEDAAQAFERYDLVSAPVVDLITGSLVGRVTVNAVMDYIREKSAEKQLAEAGLSKEEDVFAPVWNSFRNRWAWLAINLVTAFIASRVIGAFEGSIEKLVALAALMPIVAGIGGNSGNQTITMIVRALALGQIQSSYWRKLIAKELGVAMLNGVLWGIAARLRGLPALRQRRPRRRDGAGHDAHAAARGRHGRGDSLPARALRPGSRGRLVGADHRLHRLGRLLHLPRPRDAVPAIAPLERLARGGERRVDLRARHAPRKRSPPRRPRARGTRRARAWRGRIC